MNTFISILLYSPKKLHLETCFFVDASASRQLDSWCESCYYFVFSCVFIRLLWSVLHSNLASKDYVSLLALLPVSITGPPATMDSRLVSYGVTGAVMGLKWGLGPWARWWKALERPSRVAQA